jgi:hypothetical protein
MARPHNTSAFTRLCGVLFSAALTVSGCIGTAEFTEYSTDYDNLTEEDSLSHPAVDEELTRVEAAARRAFDEGSEEPEAEGLILAPEMVTGYVGEMLVVEVLLSNPELGELRPASLPEEVIFEAWAGGASVEWVPEPRHIGKHNFVFLVVDGDDPDLVLAQKSILVSVLPRFSLVEYGF